MKKYVNWNENVHRWVIRDKPDGDFEYCDEFVLTNVNFVINTKRHAEYKATGTQTRHAYIHGEITTLTNDNIEVGYVVYDMENAQFIFDKRVTSTSKLHFMDTGKVKIYE